MIGKILCLTSLPFYRVGTVITAMTGVVLGPIGFALLGLGIGVFQADQARKALVKEHRKNCQIFAPGGSRTIFQNS